MTTDAPTGTTETSSSATHHVRVIDGLRGIAVLMVVLFHYWQITFWTIPIPGLSRQYSLEVIQTTGFIGVELFFFISAFCLFYPHAKTMFGQGAVPTLRHFYYRRAIKILPSYLLVLFLMGTVLSDLFPSTTEHGKLFDTGMHLLFLHNLTPETRGSFNGVLWSLAVEVQFYVIFPLLAAAFRRLPWLTALGMIAVAAAYRNYIAHLNINDFYQNGIQLPAFLDLFGLGMLTAYLLLWIRHRRPQEQALRVAFTALSVMGFLMLFYLLDWLSDVRWVSAQEAAWQSRYRLAIGLIFVVITLSSSYSLAFWRGVVANRVLIFLSGISYNLYLWHQAIPTLMRKHNWWHSSIQPPTSDPTWRWSFFFVSLTVSVVFSWMITQYFERPLLRLGVRGALGAIAIRLVELQVLPKRAAPQTVAHPAAAVAEPSMGASTSATLPE